MSESITLHPAVTLALQQSEDHCALASKATTDAERRAHLSTVRALNKAAMEMVKGNVPQAVGDGQYLVNSRTNAGVVYRVDVFGQRCDCANQHACWHLAACNVLEEVATREANDGDLLPQGARDLLAESTFDPYDEEDIRTSTLGREIEYEDGEPTFTRAEEERLYAIADYYEGLSSSNG